MNTLAMNLSNNQIENEVQTHNSSKQHNNNIYYILLYPQIQPYSFKYMIYVNHLFKNP